MSAQSHHSNAFTSDHVSRGNGSYQRKLADSLRETLGRAAAISACQAYGWEGVIQYLVTREAEAV